MTTPHGRGDAPIEAPATECTTPKWCAENGCQHRWSLAESLRAESRLGEDGYQLVPLDDALRALAAAVAAARAEGRQEAVRDARRLVERHTDAKESRDSGDHCTWECYIPTFDDFDHEVAGLNASESGQPRHHPNDNCGDPNHDAILEAWYARAEVLLAPLRAEELESALDSLQSDPLFHWEARRWARPDSDKAAHLTAKGFADAILARLSRPSDERSSDPTEADDE